MKIYCAYAFTGEDLGQITPRMQAVVAALRQAGHDAYCPLFDSQKMALQAKDDTRGIFTYVFEKMITCDAMTAIVTSARRSEGLLMEIGAILAAKKPLYLFVHESAAATPSHLPKLATRTYAWSTNEDLEQALAQV